MDTHSLPILRLMKKSYRGFPVVLLLILLLATVLRFVFLGSLPVSIYWDEASAGYNAYSILQTGRDEHGVLLPFFFRSFDDAKMPVMIYLTTLPIALFGLQEFSVRFIAALSGVLTIFLTYLFTRELFIIHDKQKRYAEAVGIMAALLLTISPWHLQFSRAGFEGTVALCLIVAGAYVYLKAFTRPWLFFFSACFFILSCITYRSAILFVPVLVIGMSLLFMGKLKHIRPHYPFVISTVIVFIFWLSLAFTLYRGDTRFTQVSIFSPDNSRVAERIQKQAMSENSFLSKVIYNRRIVYAQITAEHYFSHFNPRFLFMTGDGNGRHTVTGMGLMYSFEAVFLLFGAWWLYRREKRMFFVLFVWLLAAPLAASISTPAPHALRSLTMLPALQIVTATGMVAIYTVLSRQWRPLYTGVLSILILVSGALFLQRYTYHNGVIASAEWADGYKDLVQEVRSLENKYDKIVITGYGWQPYIYFLFYTQYDPSAYHRNGSSDGFSRYRFGGTSWDRQVEREELDQVDLEKFAGTKNALIVLSPDEYAVQELMVRKLSEIRNHRGESAFIITELKQ